MRIHGSAVLWLGVAAWGGLACMVPAVRAESQPALVRYFGFDDPRVLVLDDDPGPAIVADVDGDGLNDLIVANNRKSRIEIYIQRATPRSDEEIERAYKVNEFKPNPWYDRTEISVAHRVTALRAADLDGDKDLDLIYAGSPGEIVVLRHGEKLAFEVDGKRRLPDLSAGQDGFEIADVLGGPEPELLVLVGGKIEVYTLGKSGPEGDPLVLGSGDSIPAFFVEDYNGDGLKDILGVVPDDDAPLRAWIQRDSGGGIADGKRGSLGPEIRFEMPRLIEVEPVRFPNRAAASVAVIEQASRRFVLFDLVTKTMEAITQGDTVLERDGNAEVHAFPGAEDKDRAVEVADIDGDGLEDLLATDAATNSLLLYRQDRVAGLADYERFSAFKPRTVAVGQWDADAPLEVFVLSEEEKTVGISDYDPATGRLGFPQPVETVTAGASPVAMSFCTWNGSPAVAIVMRDKRDHTMEIHRADGTVISSNMAEVNRPPQSMLAGDFDRDGHTDLLLFTPNEPMVMVRSKPAEVSESNPGGWSLEVLTDKQMPQYGLVQNAGPENTALVDVDGDGSEELLIADGNFIRACQFDPTKGWRVVDQVTIAEPNTELGSLTVLRRGGETLVVATDRGNKRLLITGRDAKKAWVVTDKIRLTGIDLGPIRAGSFGGDTEPTILVRSTDGFAVVRLSGEIVAMEEVSAYRSDEDDRLEHEIEIGDVNSDGYLDLVYLDAKEQMCGILSFSASRKLVPATEFKVFETRLFEGGGGNRSFEPASAIISDLTGDGAQDIILQAHDRYLIYPQMNKKK